MTEFAENVRQRTGLVRSIKQQEQALVVNKARFRVINDWLDRTSKDDIWLLIPLIQEVFDKNNHLGSVTIKDYHIEEPKPSALFDPNQFIVVLHIKCLSDIDYDDKKDLGEIFLSRLHSLRPEINRLNHQYGVEFVISGEFV